MVPKTKQIINKCYYLLSINSSSKETINNMQPMILTINSSSKEAINNIQPMIVFHKNPSLKQLKRTNNKKQPKTYYTYTNSNHSSMYSMLHQSITLLPASF